MKRQNSMKNSRKIILLTLLISSCVTAKMKTERNNFDSNAFETNGFYYTKPNKNNYYESNLYVFYKNGVLFGGFSVGSSINEIKDFLNNDNYINNVRERAYSWGVFQVIQDSVTIEKWISSDAFGRYPTINFSGKIIDDKKIVINFPIVHSTIKSPNEFKQDTLYFYHFKEKPDSTNRFIK